MSSGDQENPLQEQQPTVDAVTDQPQVPAEPVADEPQPEVETATAPGAEEEVNQATEQPAGELPPPGAEETAIATTTTGAADNGDDADDDDDVLLGVAGAADQEPQPQQQTDLIPSDSLDDGFPVADDDASVNPAAQSEQQDQQQEDAAAAAAESAATAVKVFSLPEGTTLADLFGANFEPRAAATGIPQDPEEVDIQRVIEDNFGAGDEWASLVFLPVEGEVEQVIDPSLLPFAEVGSEAIQQQLEAHILEQEGLVALDEVVHLFGEAAARIVVEAIHRGKVAGQTAQVVSLPRPQPAAFIKKAEDEPLAHTTVQRHQQQHAEKIKGLKCQSWLLHMPTIYPNRRSAHIERNPYTPGLSPINAIKKPSSSRAIFTPLNVIRWAHDESRNKDLSNARMVKWSDGSWTLHVGTDVYTITEDKTTSLAVVGQEIENTTPEFAPYGIEDENARKIFVETAPYTMRAQLLPSGGDAGHSVENFLVAENRVRSAKSVATSVKLTSESVVVTKPPVPGVPKNKFDKKRIEGSDELADYLSMQDRERERVLRERTGGREPTIYDRLAYDADVLQDVSKAQSGGSADFEHLLEKAKDEIAQATAASALARGQEQFQTYLDSKNQQQQLTTMAGGVGGDRKKKKKSKFDRDLTIGDALAEDEAAALLDGDDDEDDMYHQQRQQSTSSGISSVQAGKRRTREEADGEIAGSNNAITKQIISRGESEGNNELTAERLKVLEKLRNLRRMPDISADHISSIDSLSDYFDSNHEISAENMLVEVQKLESEISQSVTENAQVKAN